MSDLAELRTRSCMSLESLKELAAEIARLRRKVELLETTPWLHPKDVMAIFGIGRTTLHRWRKCGKIPRPTRVYGPIWRRSDLARCKGGRTRPDKRPDGSRTS